MAARWPGGGSAGGWWATCSRSCGQLGVEELQGGDCNWRGGLGEHVDTIKSGESVGKVQIDVLFEFHLSTLEWGGELEVRLEPGACWTEEVLGGRR